MVRLRHLFLLAAAFVAWLPVFGGGYTVGYSDHPETGGVCPQDNRQGKQAQKSGGSSGSSFGKYGYWAEFTGDYSERSLGFDNAGAKERLYSFKVHYYGDNLIKSECGGRFKTPYAFRLYFWKDRAMTQPYLMDFTRNPVQMYDGYEVAGNTWDDPNNADPDRRNYLCGTRSDLNTFDVCLRQVVLDDFFHQGCGVYDVDTFATVYFQYVPDIPSLNKSTMNTTVGSFRWWHIRPPEEPKLTSEVVDTKEFGAGEARQEPTGGSVIGWTEIRDAGGIICVWPPISDENEPDENEPDENKHKRNGQGGDPPVPPGPPEPPGPEKQEKTTDATPAEHKHEWNYEKKRISHWCPYKTRLSYGSIGIDMQLVRDERDSVAFYVMTAPVSQRLYQHEMDENPSAAVDLSAPVTNVSLSDATFFKDRLNMDVSEAYGIKFRVPEKEEWLLAASQLEDMGRDYDEVIGTYEVEFGARETGTPKVKERQHSSSPKSVIRLVADQLIESALPLEVNVRTNAKYGSRTDFRRVTRTLEVMRCKTCGKTVSRWLAD